MQYFGGRTVRDSPDPPGRPGESVPLSAVVPVHGHEPYGPQYSVANGFAVGVRYAAGGGEHSGVGTIADLSSLPPVRPEPAGSVAGAAQVTRGPSPIAPV